MTRPSYKKRKSFTALSMVVVSAVFVASAMIGSAPARAGAPVATAPYTISVFAASVPGSYTQPDSIAFADLNVFVAFGNGTATDGSDGQSSTVVEYTPAGTVVKTYTVPGHVAALKGDPDTGRLWALANPAANPSLTIIQPSSGVQNNFTFPPTAHGGGYDGLSFRNGLVYISASNPSTLPNAAPAILQAAIPQTTTVQLTPVLSGNASAIDALTGSTVTLNLENPSSMIFDSGGDLVLSSPPDSEVILVHDPDGADRSVFRVGLTLTGSPVQVGDIVFATSPNGMLLVSDTNAELVYAINKAAFIPGHGYTCTATSVAKVDLEDGALNPFVTGLTSAHGMVFIDASDFALSFDPGGITVAPGTAITALINTGITGDLSGNIAISPPAATPVKGIKLLTGSVSTRSPSIVQLKVKGSVAAGVYVLPYTGTDGTGRTRQGAFKIVVN
jgi:hypothetical protein